MSRNIGTTECTQCGGGVVLEGDSYLIRDKSDERIRVAPARCGECATLYLAWTEHYFRKPPPHGYTHHQLPCDGHAHFDLSYRSTFDDEPGDSDIGIDPSIARARRALREVTRATADECLEVAEMWMQRADELRKAAS